METVDSFDDSSTPAYRSAQEKLNALLTCPAQNFSARFSLAGEIFLDISWHSVMILAAVLVCDCDIVMLLVCISSVSVNRDSAYKSFCQITLSKLYNILKFLHFSQSFIPTLCPKKTCDYIFYNNFNNSCPITIIFGIVSSKSMRHRKMVSLPTSPI